MRLQCSLLRRFNPRNGIQMGYTSFIFQWQNGKQVILYPGNVAQGNPSCHSRRGLAGS
jgi:hypothetical protein